MFKLGQLSLNLTAVCLGLTSSASLDYSEKAAVLGTFKGANTNGLRVVFVWGALLKIPADPSTGVKSQKFEGSYWQGSVCCSVRVCSLATSLF